MMRNEFCKQFRSALFVVSMCIGANTLATDVFVNAPPKEDNKTIAKLVPDHPVDDVITFDHPKDWQVVPRATPDTDGPIEAKIKSKNGQGSLVIRVQPRDEVDLIKYDLDQLSKMGYTVTRTKPEPNSAMGKLRGEGTDYDLEKDGKRYRMYHLLVEFDVKHDVLIRALATERYWNASKRGVVQIVESLAIGDLYQIDPDVEHPMHIAAEQYAFDAPGNWHKLERNGSFYTGYEISAMQYSWFTISVFDRKRKITAAEELDMYLKHSIDDQLVSHSEMGSWMGLDGVGAQGILHESLAGDQRFKAIFVPLADGKILVVKQYQALSSKARTDPGFDLIESSFKLLVDPSPSEP